MGGWVVDTHRFDCGRDDVKNNERGRGQERGCDLTPTRNCELRYYHRAQCVYIAYSYRCLPVVSLYVESVQCLHNRLRPSGSLEMVCYRLSDTERHEYLVSSHAYAKTGRIAMSERNYRSFLAGRFRNTGALEIDAPHVTVC